MRFEQKIKLAEDYEASGKYLHALQLYKFVVTSDKHKKFALFKIASMYVNLNNIDAAITLLDEYVLENPEDSEARVFYARFLISVSSFDRAVEILDATDDTTIELLFTKAQAYFGVNDLRKVRMLLRELITRCKSPKMFAESYLLLAKCEIRSEKYEDAITYLKNSLEYDYDNVESLYLLATIYYRKGMYYHGVELIELAVERSPDRMEVVLLAGKINYKLKNYDLANEFLRKYIKLGGDENFVVNYLSEIDKILRSRVGTEKHNPEYPVNRISDPEKENTK